MIIVGVVVAVLVLGGAAAWAVARTDVLQQGVPEAVGTQSAQPLPPGPLQAPDVHDVRFDQAVRGYRTDQVDAALARLADELAERDAEIALLREETAQDHQGGPAR